MRRRLITSAALGLCLALTGSDAWAQSGSTELVLTVAPLRGKSGAQCARTVSDLLSKQMRVEAWDDPRGVGGFEGFEALSRFIEARGRALGAQIVVIGTARTKKLILEAYDVQRGALLNITRVPISPKLPSCSVGRRGREVVIAFAQRAAEAYKRRQQRAVAAAPAPPKSAPPKTAPPKSPAPPPAAPPSTATATVASPAPPPLGPPPPPEEDPFDGADAVFRDDLDLPAQRRARTATATPARRKTFTWLEVDFELGLSQRSFTFEDAEGLAVANYQIGAMFTPGIRAKLRPLAGAGPAWLRPLGLDVAFRQSPGFDSRRFVEGPKVATRFSELAGMLRYPIAIPKSRFVVSPELGGHFMQYSLRGVAGGAASRDTPSTVFGSLLLGLGLRARVVEQADVRLSAAYMPVLGGGQIFSAAYYPEASAWALRVEAALTVHVTSWLLVVVTGHYTGYQVDLGGDVTAAGVPAQASDRTTGLRLGLRVGL